MRSYFGFPQKQISRRRFKYKQFMENREYGWENEEVITRRKCSQERVLYHANYAINVMEKSWEMVSNKCLRVLSSKRLRRWGIYKPIAMSHWQLGLILQHFQPVLHRQGRFLLLL